MATRSRVLLPRSIRVTNTGQWPPFWLFESESRHQYARLNEASLQTLASVNLLDRAYSFRVLEN